MKKITSMLLTLCMLLSLCVGVAADGSELPFTDVKESNWYYGAVEYVYTNGLMNGTSEVKFAPLTTVTRAMFVTMLGRLAGAEENPTNTFSDIDPVSGSWYVGYVGWAADNGIVTGYPDGTFKPNAKLTREVMATIISRYIEYAGILAKKTSDKPSYFVDEEAIGSWATKYVNEMRLTGIVKGNNKGEFNPKGELSRAEAATIIMRLSQMIDELTLGEANTIDYTVDGGVFNLLGAWDLYYSGTAVGTGYGGIEVATGDTLPYLTYNNNRTQFLFAIRFRLGDDGNDFATYPTSNPLITGYNYYEFDSKATSIDIAAYPVVRIGYRTDGGDAKLGLYYNTSSDAANAKGEEVAFTPSDEAISGWKYGIIDTTGEWSSWSQIVSPTIYSQSNLELLYIAFFPNMASAEAFDVTAYADRLSSYSGEVTELIPASDSDVDAAIAEANAKAQEIVNCDVDIDPTTVEGTCYYISSINGDDSNDGLSPETPWRSFNNLYKHVANNTIHLSTLSSGDAVLIERGSVMYRSEYGEYDFLDFVNGITYGAYGEGEKPIITQKIKLDTPAGTWTETEYANVWKIELGYDRDIGNIHIVDGERDLWGVKVVPKDSTNPFGDGTLSVRYGIVYNGEEIFRTGGTTLDNPDSLDNNLEFISDYTNSTLYMYCDKGNPGEIYDEINFSRAERITGMFEENLTGTDDIIVDNLHYCYTGSHGMGLGETSNLTVRNCVFTWIGGCLQYGTTRYGNAIENWINCDGIFVENCYFKDIYDAAVTTQGYYGTMTNFHASGNVLDGCDLSFEFFNYGENGGYTDTLSNVFVTDNYVINNGYGFCDVRVDRRSAFVYGSYQSCPTVMDNFVYAGNVNVYSAEFAVFCYDLALGQTSGLITRDNVYYMDPSEAYYAVTGYNIIKRTGADILLPYTSQYLTFLNALGVESGSTFYSVKNPKIDGSR